MATEVKKVGTRYKNSSEALSNVFDALQSSLGLENVNEAPTLEKIVVSTGVSSVTDPRRRELIVDRLQKITGQKPSARQAKKSIAAFKSRQGDIIGYQVTLRGKKMYSFLDKLIHIALPRTKDFRGISLNSIDEMGNITIGIKEHTIFPETSDEDIVNIFGLAITLVSSAQDVEAASAFFQHIGLPFKSE